MYKIGLTGEALYYYTTILYSTGVKVVVNTTVGHLGAVGIRPDYQAAGWTQ